MYIDDQLRFSSAQDVTSSAVGANKIDLSVDRSIGTGEPMGVMFTVVTAATTGDDDEDYTFDVEYASNAAQTTGRELIGRRVFESGTPDAPAQDADLLVAGFRFVIPIPQVTLAESDRYLGVRYTTAGTGPTVTMTADLLPLSMIQGEVSYPKNYTIQ